MSLLQDNIVVVDDTAARMGQSLFDAEKNPLMLKIVISIILIFTPSIVSLPRSCGVASLGDYMCVCVLEFPHRFRAVGRNGLCWEFVCEFVLMWCCGRVGLCG